MAKTVFGKRTIEHIKSGVVLSASYMIEFLDEDDNIMSIGYPDEWADLICRLYKGDNTKCVSFKIYGRSMKNGLHNRITDNKKIWGIQSIPIGDHDGFYDTTDSRIYWGVSISRSIDTLLFGKEDFTIIVPSEVSVETAVIINLLKKENYSFQLATDCAVLSLLQCLIPKSIIYRLSNYNSQVMLHIFSDEP